MCDCGCESLQQANINGADGIDGLNSYQLAVQTGEFTGTLAEYQDWLRGETGYSAYMSAVNTGFDGDESAWVASLSGTDGTDGTDGVNAFTTLTVPMQQPEVGGYTEVYLGYSPQLANASWLSIGCPVHIGGTTPGDDGNWYIVTAIVLNTVILLNPGPDQGYPSGIGTNAPPGTVIPEGSRVSARGRDGRDGADGADGGPGPVGPVGPGPVITDTVPGTTPGPTESHLVLVVDSYTATTTAKWYMWNGSSWDMKADVSPVAGSKTLFVSGDPNGHPDTFGAIGDVAFDNGTPGMMEVWQKTGASTWVSKGSIEGGASLRGPLFRVGMSTDQPIAKGSTGPTTLQLDKDTPPPLFNSGRWDGSKYIVEADIARPVTFRLEALRVYTTDSAESPLTFTVDLMVNGSSVASSAMVLDGMTEMKMALLDHTAPTLDKDDEVKVTVTPSANPDSQWFIDFTTTVFYNQI